MAHSDVYIILNIITWGFILFIFLYLLLILLLLPTLYNHIRLRIYIYNLYSNLFFLSFLEVTNINIFCNLYFFKENTGTNYIRILNNIFN